MIEEIEEMMQESPDPEEDETPTQSDRLSILSQEIQTLKRSSTNNSYEESKWYLFIIFALMLSENILKVSLPCVSFLANPSYEISAFKNIF